MAGVTFQTYKYRGEEFVNIKSLLVFTGRPSVGHTADTGGFPQPGER